MSTVLKLLITPCESHNSAHRRVRLVGLNYRPSVKWFIQIEQL